MKNKMKTKPDGFYSRMTKEQWIGYGRQNNLDKLSRSELQEEVGSYYKRGIEKGWVVELIPEIKKRIDLPTQEIIDLHKNGGSTSKIAKKYNVHPSTIRRLLKKHHIKLKNGFWGYMSDKEVIEYVKRLSGDKKFSPSELEDFKPMCYKVLRLRGLLEKVCDYKLKRNNKSRIMWSTMSNKELLEYGLKQGLYLKNKKPSPKELEKLDDRYYDALLKRKLIGLVCNYKQKSIRISRNWSSMSNGELLKHGLENGMLLENEKVFAKELAKHDLNYYRELRKRKLLEKVCYYEQDPKQRKNWKKMSDMELIEYTRGLFPAVPSPNELSNHDRICYREVRKRKLLEKVCAYKHRNWKKMSNKELIKYHKEQYPDKISPSELESADKSYYRLLRKRGLIREVCAYKKLIGFYNNMNKKQWLAYGIKKGFDKLSRSELGDVAGRYYQLGNQNGWIDELIPKNNGNMKQVLDNMLNDYMGVR